MFHEVSLVFSLEKQKPFLARKMPQEAGRTGFDRNHASPMCLATLERRREALSAARPYQPRQADNVSPHAPQEVHPVCRQ